MLLTTVSCGANGGKTDESTADTTAESVEETTAETEAAAPAYDGIFQVGFGREDITPKGKVVTNTGKALTRVIDNIYSTCIAVYDGETTVLIITADVKNTEPSMDEKLKSMINVQTKVPKENIIISATHNHSAPQPGTPANASWNTLFYTQTAKAAKAAIADLADAEIYSTTGKTTGMAYVRRYLLDNGLYGGIQNKNTGNIVAYESEADDIIQIVKFARKDKQDIIISNWQCHVAGAEGFYPDAITSDLVYYVRDAVEKSGEYLYAYYLGASGNINTVKKVEDGTPRYADYRYVGKALGKLVCERLEATEEMQKLNAGKIKVQEYHYIGNVRDIDPVKVKQAEEIAASGAKGSTAYEALVKKYGFHGSYEVERTITVNSEKGGTRDMLLAAIAFGDLAFTGVPYEMFDTNGMEVKNGSPYKMTFVLTCAGGQHGYIPSALAVPHGGYEVYYTALEFGTAEKVVAKLLEMLEEFHS